VLTSAGRSRTRCPWFGHTRRTCCGVNSQLPALPRALGAGRCGPGEQEERDEHCGPACKRHQSGPSHSFCVKIKNYRGHARLTRWCSEPNIRYPKFYFS
jgi:hypothetical protein